MVSYVCMTEPYWSRLPFIYSRYISYFVYKPTPGFQGKVSYSLCMTEPYPLGMAS